MTTAEPARDLRLGIDVGGTNTDGVIMQGTKVLCSAKRPTRSDVGGGVIDVVNALFEQLPGTQDRIRAAMIGTTQFVNAFVQRQQLSPVAAVRVSLPKSDGVPPMIGWPPDLLQILGEHSYLVKGGSFYTGKEYAALDPAELESVARDIRSKKITAIAVVSNFAPVRPDIEQQAAAILAKFNPDADIVCSASVGGLGLLDRENAAIVNASLMGLSRRVIDSLIQAFGRLNIHAPLFLSQNDGTLLTADAAVKFPVLTCSAGPTNSIRGAAFLTGLSEAIVVDIGGTTTDVGFLSRGFPRETAKPHFIGGVRTNFRMPDVLSIALGGGTRVHAGRGQTAGQTAGQMTLGPDSVGYRLTELGRAFGGAELTTTDIAVRLGNADLGDARKLADIDLGFARQVQESIHRRIEDAIDEMKTNSRPVPAILVGGGSILVSRDLAGVSVLHRPQHWDVTNAVGAAIARVSGRVDRLFDYDAGGRDAALALAKQEATDAALAAGADSRTVEIVDIVELPMTHMRSSAVQLKVRAVGDLDLEAAR